MSSQEIWSKDALSFHGRSTWVLGELWASWSSLWLHQKHLPILQLGSQKHLSWHSQWSLSRHPHKKEGSHIAKRTKYSQPTTCRMLLSSYGSELQVKCNMGFRSPFSWEYLQVLSMIILDLLRGSKIFERPKSIIFMSDSSVLFWKRKFSGFRSQWQTPELWQ